MFRLLILSSILFSSSLSFAVLLGRDTNGGVGVYHEGRLQVLDLVEGQVPHTPVSGHYSTRHLKVLSGVMPLAFPHKKIAIKIRDIGDFSYPLMLKLLREAQDMTWSFTDRDLYPTTDYSDLNQGSLQNYELHQLAIRNGSQVKINRILWNQMDEDSQTALIMHEMIYYLFDKNSVILESRKVRQFTALLFHRKAFKKMSSSIYEHQMWLRHFGLDNNN